MREVDALELFAPNGSSRPEAYDAVMANPPFVRRELQSQMQRNLVDAHTNSVVGGKSDTYIAFLLLGIRALRIGGFGFFVVPQPLLTSPNLRALRNWILEHCWVHVIADLSAIRVFDANVYVALLILQRKGVSGQPPPHVTSVRCEREAGVALEEALSVMPRRTANYSIYQSSQEVLQRSTWSVTTPDEAALLDRLETLPNLRSIATVFQGVISGADSVFVVTKAQIPEGEEALYRPLLRDGDIGQFVLPNDAGEYLLYPHISGEDLTAADMEYRFPASWEMLTRNFEDLRRRRGLANPEINWWKPGRMRDPGLMLAPKIVTPEAALIPRFAVDVSGEWIVSHKPVIALAHSTFSADAMYVLTAILNSSVAAWHIDLNARKLNNGYNKIAVALLKGLPVPDLGRGDSRLFRRISYLVRLVIDADHTYSLETIRELDDIVCRELYGLSPKESLLFSIDAPDD